MKITIRKFTAEDISNKVRWINDERNNTFLHYDIPLEIGKTEKWFENNKDRTDRYDAVIEVDKTPVGLIGLLSIDRKNRKAEYYISMGEQFYKGKGVAYSASKLLLEYAFGKLNLQRVYLYTETENIPAQRLFEKAGFVREGIAKCDLFSKGRFVDRYAYGITKDMFYKQKGLTPIQFVDEINQNKLYVKREDMIPYSFGGNKARKAKLFFDEIDSGLYDYVVSYGSSHSNHCRIVSNMSAARNIPCCIIAPKEVSDETYNSRMMELFGAEIITVPVEQVHETIETKLKQLREDGYRPYFIPGGGHGNIGTQAYVDCYNEIITYEKENNIHFDYIFFATGTGTTQAGLVCGQLLNGDDRKIVGISIARKNPRGCDVVKESITDFLDFCNMDILFDEIEKKTIFVDSYVGDGYGKNNSDIKQTIQNAMKQYGIPLDATYTGKAFFGMLSEMKRLGILGANILFIHTGGTPLFFDELEQNRAGR